MGEWKTEILDKLCFHIQSGGTPKSDNEEYYNGEIPFVAIEDITTSNKYLLKTKKHISEEGLKNSAAWLVPKDSLMYSIYATLGSTLISKIDAATNQAILNLIVNTEKIDIEYLYYFLISLKNQIYKYSAQTTQSNLNAAIVKAFEIKYPEDKPEQIHIAEILSTADEAIAHTEALIAKYQRIKTGLMQDLLTKGIDENGNIRSKETHKFVVKNGVEVPEEWEVKQIEEVAILKSGGTPSRQNLSFWNGDTPWVKTGEINYEIICKTEEYITEKGLTNSSAVLFPKNTILMALYGQGKTRGRVGILGIDASTNQACIGFLNLNGITRDFLYITLTNEYENLRELSNDGAQKNLSGSLLNKYKIKVPSDIDEQKRIDSVFLEIDNLINEQKNNLAKLQSLKTGLMQDLLSGKVRVNMNNKN